MSESESISISSEEIMNKAREIVVKLRDLEKRIESLDPKTTYSELKNIIGEARNYGLDRCFIPLVRKLKRMIEYKRMKMLKEKLKTS